MIKRLRAKFVCINMALVMAMLIVVFVLVYHFTAKSLETESINTLKTAAADMPRPKPGQSTAPCFILTETRRGELIVSGGFFDLGDEDLVSDIYALARDADSRIGVLDAYSLRFYRAEDPMGQRYVFADISAERSALQNLIQNCALIGVAAFGGFLAISILLAKWAIRPVETAWKNQRQFISDASHELKTPLTVILTNAELLQSKDHSPDEKKRFADSILTMSRQMRSLVENLLDLARADSGRVREHMESVDLSQLAEDAVLPFEPIYFEQGLNLETVTEPEILVRGSRQHLSQVLDILLDNGQKYSAPGGTARLTLSRQGRKAQLRFFSPGTPLTAQQCTDIFKRFYRVDEARTGSGSYGLGLSIAQRIVEEHGGRIFAQGAEDGNVFTVLLPGV